MLKCHVIPVGEDTQVDDKNIERRIALAFPRIFCHPITRNPTPLGHSYELDE